MILYTTLVEKDLAARMQDYNRDRNSCAIYFNLSKLKVKRDNKEHITIAANILKDQMKANDGDIFVLGDDVLMLMKTQNEKAIAESVYQLRYLFSDDPMAYDGRGAENKSFYTLYNRTNWRDLVNLCQKFIADNDNKINHSKKSLLAFISENIEAVLAEFNWTKIIQINNIITNPLSDLPKVILAQVSIDFDNFKRSLGANLDIVNNINLFGFIREFLEIRLLIRLLDLLANNSKVAGYYVNISFATLNSEEFSIFDEALKDSERTRIVIGIHISDVYRDLGEFFKMRDFLVSRGYRLCLHGVDNTSFMHIDRNQLGFDLIKLKWEPNLQKQNYDEVARELKNKIQISGTSRVILANCDSKQAIITGTKLGIQLFHGSVISEFNI